MDETRADDPFFTTKAQLNIASELSLKTLAKGTLSVAQYRRDTPDLGLTTPNPVSDLYMATVKLRGASAHGIWRDGHHLGSFRYRRGGLSIFDFRSSWTTDLREPFNTINFFVPHAAFDELAYQYRSPKIEMSLLSPHHTDDVMLHLALALAPAFERPGEMSRLFADHVATAIVIHLAGTYGGLNPRHEAYQGGLASWQERRVKEMMAADLRGDMGLAALANACGLSVGHFARSFKKTTGTTAHKWLLDLRIEQAKILLLRSEMSLSDIATACGFADQSHLTRVFARLVGATPAAWRQQRLS